MIPYHQFLAWAETMKQIKIKGRTMLTLGNCFKVTSPERRLLHMMWDPFVYLKSALEDLAYDFYYETIIQRPRDKEFFFYGELDLITQDVQQWIEYWEPRIKSFEQIIKANRRRYAAVALNSTDKDYLNNLFKDIIDLVNEVRVHVEAMPNDPTLSPFVYNRNKWEGYRRHVKLILKYATRLKTNISKLKEATRLSFSNV